MLFGFPSGRYCPVLSAFVAPITWGSASVPLLVKTPGPRSAMATRTVSRPPPSVVWAKCRKLNRPLFSKLLLSPTSCTKPVMVPLLMMLVLLLVGKEEVGLAKKEGSGLATARSDKAPMLPLLVRVAVPPPTEPRTTPAADRPEVTPTLVTSGCQPPLINPPDGMVTVTPPLPPVALIAVPNSPWVDTLLAVTSTGPVIKVVGRFCAVLRKVPLSARIPIALEPSALIGPVAREASTVTLPLAVVASWLPDTATMPMPPPP